jgi:NADH dehydrogenase [ubiquinone] 1 alpha subcomplex assembly factor 7
MSAGPAASRTTPLAAKLAARIRKEGPVSVADYMRACLADPEHGYYRKSAAIGRGGDFITAPEISQVFGELIGLWCAVVWQSLGAPSSVRLMELGPGRGTLMRDALRAARADPAFRAALDVHLIESNATLESSQRASLAGEALPIRWSADIERREAPAPTIVIANEFLDTLPVAQWVFREGRWHQRCVGLGELDALCFTAGEADDAVSTGRLARAPQDGDILESRTVALAGWASKLARCGAPLAALFIDYGHLRPAIGDTLQAVATHRYDDPLRAPGEADLSAQVDFAGVAEAMRDSGFACDGPVPQGRFLSALGIVERASRLMAVNPLKAATIEAGVARLLAPSGMGTRFCVLGVRSKGVAPLPGFEPVDIARRAP